MATKRKQDTPSIPAWMRSPPTPENPEHMEAAGPPADERNAVEIAGRLYDRITLYRWHNYSPPAELDRAGAILSAYLRREWAGIDTDARPENRERRAGLVALATEAAVGRPSPALECRRAWRIIDWMIRVEGAALLDLAGWSEYGAAFRALPPIAGPRATPRGAATLLRRAHRDTDKASTLALSGIRPYRRKMDRHGRPIVVAISAERTRRLDPGENPAHGLYAAVRDALPGLRRVLRGDEVPPAQRTALGRALQSGAYARMCVEYDPRISDEAVARMLAAVAASGRELLRNLITMGRK